MSNFFMWTLFMVVFWIVMAIVMLLVHGHGLDRKLKKWDEENKYIKE